MKSAKEWATKTVIDSGWIEDREAAVAMCQASQVEKARSIIERLVERVQADARAPLAEEIARLRDERGADIDTAQAALDAIPVAVWTALSESSPAAVDACNALIQRINAWKSEQP